MSEEFGVKQSASNRRYEAGCALSPFTTGIGSIFEEQCGLMSVAIKDKTWLTYFQSSFRTIMAIKLNLRSMQPGCDEGFNLAFGNHIMPSQPDVMRALTLHCGTISCPANLVVTRALTLHSGNHIMWANLVVTRAKTLHCWNHIMLSQPGCDQG